ncbi:hypothetical protein LI168_14190 [Desulfovibrio desulfuricans]|uniref:hypothetical protein n=1 Tax=Desulfovibrio desulfuricans TaxID=876 RepID=UPI001D0779AF|nr:hypothetical protein [Desulfovibrio desulfuricans]MCB6543266.1 hypothetical protein [Desulfovibrio desulfuricans]MCB6554367.1 hypothetical protein [Desulfovibrio desulfuricans]MCB6566206.1 hypothetical protein [Desulfovibrio desulfuricans]MCB7347368.1 hypothetical protein [Desulfovibrio desulfuricans]MCQ5217575.1 hypothetical protein [Desulfovibrio desulfuricans]
MNNNQFIQSTATESTNAPQNGKSNLATPLHQKKRNRLSANEKKAKREAVLNDYQAGHPSLAIMLRQGLSKSQFTEILADLFMKDSLTPRAPEYEVVAVSTPIKALSQFAGSNTEYVRVKHDDVSTNLTPYIQESDNDHD